MTVTGRIIREAWAFGLIAVTETCAGRNAQGIEKLREQTLAESAKHSHQVNQLPAEIRSRYLRIQQQAYEQARNQGWGTELKDDD